MGFSNQLVILVGGKGTRLGALALETPKPLMPIDDDKVFLDYFLDSAVRQGFDEVLMLAGHLGEKVEERYHNRRYKTANINVLIEPEPMGTGGALRHALNHLAPTFVAANGDTLFDTNLRAIDRTLQANTKLEACLATRQVPDAGRFGSVDVADGLIRAFREKDPVSAAVEGTINGGLYALRRKAIARLPQGTSSIEADLFPMLAREGTLGAVSSMGYFLDIGLPNTLAQARDELPRRLRPALFLDRDGVINKDKNYLYRPEDFEWIEGVEEVIELANARGYAVIVVTNQAGVARGLYSEGDVLKLHDFMQDTLRAKGAFIDAFYYCPYHKDAAVARYQRDSHFDRKPNPGMILKAAKQNDLDLAQSILIGDQAHDVAAAAAAGVAGYLFTGGNLRQFIDEQNLLPLRSHSS